MVWFQCEDCGDNLKKPKLPNHFRQCSAYKLSCIDCGQVFGQQDVEGHTQCISEAEKYGPKGQGKTSNGVDTKPQNDAKKKPEVDINVGLSERPPWFCSLCNTKATSKQTLLLHADGKKHRAKARGFHAKQQASNTVEINGSAENNGTNKVPEKNELDCSRDVNPSNAAPPCDGSRVENNSLESNKKRNLEESENAIQIEGADAEVTKGVKKAKLGEKEEHAKLNSTTDKDVCQKKIKWKKLITSALKSNPDGALKLKELKKFVMKHLKDSGYIVEKEEVSEMIERKIDSSSRFVADGKYTRLVTNS